MSFPKNPDIFVAARQGFGNAGVEIVVYKRVGDGTVQFLRPDLKASALAGRWTYAWTEPRSQFDSLREGDYFARVDDFAPQLLAALSEAGVPAPDQSFNEGKLTATEKHLEDMRALVFKVRDP